MENPLKWLKCLKRKKSLWKSTYIWLCMEFTTNHHTWKHCNLFNEFMNSIFFLVFCSFYLYSFVSDSSDSHGFFTYPIPINKHDYDDADDISWFISTTIFFLCSLNRFSVSPVCSFVDRFNLIGLQSNEKWTDCEEKKTIFK